MLQMTIQGLEMQRATLMAIQTMTQQSAGKESEGQAVAGNAFWPWNFMQPDAKGTEAPPTKDPEPAKAAPKPSSAPKRKPKG